MSEADDWDSICESMVAKLLEEEEKDTVKMAMHKQMMGECVDKKLLDRMIHMCWNKIRQQKEARIRKSDLGGHLRYKIGSQYRRGWLKEVLHSMQEQGLVQVGEKPDMVQIPDSVLRGAKCCPFSQKCTTAHQLHMKVLVHLCPEDWDCPHLQRYLGGHPMTPSAREHFKHWKHQCPRGIQCMSHSSPSVLTEHALVFTHNATT